MTLPLPQCPKVKPYDLPIREEPAKPTYCLSCGQYATHCDACGGPMLVGDKVQGCEDGVHMHPECWRVDERAQRLHQQRMSGIYMHQELQHP